MMASSSWIPLYLQIVSGILQWAAGHVVYPIEPPRRTRHSIEEWRPLKEDMSMGIPRHGVRYPVYYKYPYSILHKKSPLQQTDNSETVEVFSSAPPSILGSLSVFGHATVNAREPASRISVKPSKSQYLQEQSELHPYYQHHHSHHTHSHNLEKSHGPYYATYDDRNVYDSSLRSPIREHVAESAISLVPHPHSSSLTPNSYFFETPQPFQPAVSDIGKEYHKIRKPVYKPVTHNPYRLSNGAQIYTSVTPIDQFKTPTHLPSGFEDSLGFNKFSKYNSHLSKPTGLSSYYSRNPFGDISLSTRRPDVSHKYNNRNHGKDEFDPYAQISARPFQKPSFTPSPSPQKEYDNKGYVTTFSSVSPTPNSVQFSTNAQPFNIHNYEGPSVKPDYVVTHQPFVDVTYPYTVTTVEGPTESPENIREEIIQPNKNNWEQSHKIQTSFDVDDARKPQVKINSYSGYKEGETLFLPTPSSDTGLRGSMSQDYNIRSKPSNSLGDYQQEKNSEDTTEYYTTELPEFTTKPPRQFSKNRRRPSNKQGEYYNKFSESEDGNVNHRPDNHKRRRKPSYGGRGSDRNRQSEFKKQRTTTTTPEPDVYEPTLYNNNEYSTMPVTEDVITNTQPFTTDISIKHDYDSMKNDYDQHTDIIQYSNENPENEVKILHNHKNIGYEDEIISTTAHPPVPLTVMTTSTTTTTSTTERPETSTNPVSSISNHLKNKYGNNRPRFSVKEYRERLNRGSSTTPAPEEVTERVKYPTRESQDILKNAVRIRGSSQYKAGSASSNNTSSSSSSNDQGKRKYKPRVGPSRYRISTSTSSSVSVAPQTTSTTTERINAFRPNTNRYKPGAGKYYSRYRTSTISPKEIDDNTQPPPKVVIKPKGVFSAKRKPFPLKTRFDSDRDPEDENIEDVMQGDIELSKYSDSIRHFDNEVLAPSVITKKMDNEATTATSAEREDEPHLSLADSIHDPTGLEALRIADLTSSSSNDFHTTGFRQSNHRNLPKIAFPTEEPILPLEAFFQTHSNKD